MPDCFWTGFIGSYASECGADTPPPDGCEGVPPPPASVGLGGSTSGYNGIWDWDCPNVSWTPPVLYGYVVSPLWNPCSGYDAYPTSVTYIRECDAATFIVPVHGYDINCC